MEGVSQSTLAEHIEREVADYEDLLARLQALQANPGPRKTMVELGAGVWADARIESVRTLTVEIGLGVCLDMQVDEAVKFTQTKIASLQRQSKAIARWQI